MYEDPKQFYVTLFSKTPSNQYSNNTITIFTAEFTRPARVGTTDNWEVGVFELTFPQTMWVRVRP